MSDNAVKSWERPWTSQEIIDSASNWSLAGDAGLLKHLEAFSETLLSKTNETNDNLKRLFDSLENASISLDIVKNELRSLQNTQFIENRVYDEDETLPVEQKHDDKVEDAKSLEDKKVKAMKEAVLRGLVVVDKYFDKIDVPGSDSEDETDFGSFALRPKDPYIDRRLPYVIGSDEWHKKWHVGLRESSSESETEKIDKFSDTDSEADLPVRDRTQVPGVSNSGSEADLSNKIRINHPVASSTFNDSEKQLDLFASSDSDEYNSVPAQAPIANKNFAEQLAAKLGNVIGENGQFGKTEVNKRPIQKRIVGDLFSDEPPPLDEVDDDLFSSKTKQQGIFSAGQNLFDDVDGDSTSFWRERLEKPGKSQAAAPKVPGNLFDDEDVPGTFTTNTQKTKPIYGELFDDEDEDDLFSSAVVKTDKKPYLQSLKPTAPLFSEEPPELEPDLNQTRKTKPEGGISLFGNTDLFGDQKIGSFLENRRQSSSEGSDYEAPAASKEPENLAKHNENLDQQKKAVGLFDDDDLLEDDLFSSFAPKKFTSGGLFDDAAPSPEQKSTKSGNLFEEDDLFANNVPEAGMFGTSVNLFDPDPPELEDWDTKSENNLFDDNDPVSYDVVAELSGLRSSLFDNEPPSLNSNESSGIVRDQSTRLETDDSSSFYPYASSSRRLSTDIFNEQQSNDSLFVTKNKSNVESLTLPPSLDVIPENTSASENLDITPSGNADDLFTSSSEGSVFLAIVPVNITATSSGISNLDSARESPKVEAISAGLGELFTASLSESVSGDLDATPKVDFDGLFSDSTDHSFFAPGNKSNADFFASPQSTGDVSKVKTGFGNLDGSDIVPKPDSATEELDITAKAEKNVSDAAKRSKLVSLFDDDGFSDSDDIFSMSSKSVKPKGTVRVFGGKSEGQGIGKVGAVFGTGSDGDEEGNLETKLGETKAGSADFRGNRQEEVPKNESPGKLKHNLNINVSALMPGAVPPKNKNIERSRSLENNKNDVPAEQKQDGSGDGKRTMEKSLSLENQAGLTDTLHSMTKDRARPVNRRPSTRKARQNAIRNSGTDFKLNLPDEEPVIALDNLFAESKSASVQTKLLFDSPASEIGPRIERSEDERGKTENSRNANLFDDSDECDDIFSARKLPRKPAVSKKSLFDDELDDDEDIFGAPSAAGKAVAVMSAGKTKTMGEKIGKSRNLVKISNIDLADPLNAFEN